jgi:E3 ubiquitin-protein ligase RFWD3
MVHNINDEMRTTVEEEVVTEVVTNEINTENESLFENKDKSNIIYTQNGENSDNCCIICTEMWTTTADHQLVSLSCGHLFGRSCIEKWLQPSRHTQRCPQCNKTAKKKDIRTIYARNLRALDTSERDEVLAQLEKERLKNKKLELELIEHSNKIKNILKENERLKKECMECQQKVKQLSSCSRNTENIISNKALKAMTNKLDAFKLFKEIEINSSGECRLLGYSNLFEVMAVSQPNPNTNLFPGFGIKKIFLNDFKTDNICIHSKTIKDFEINAYDGTILTTSLDKTVKLTSLLSKQSIMSYNLEVEAWSVAFNHKNKHEFYAGLRNGQILLFDTRMLYRPVDLLNSLEKTPVVSLNYINYEHSFLNTSGILSTQFNSFCFYERLNTSDSISSSSFSIINIPFEGRFTSAHFEPKSGLALLSCRPSVKHKNVTHFVSLSFNLFKF